jgi:hypothetical protein
MRMEDIRKELTDIGGRIARLAEETKRRKPTRKAPARPEPVVTRPQVVSFFKKYPSARQVDAAHHFGVNQRAISIALNGKRR